MFEHTVAVVEEKAVDHRMFYRVFRTIDNFYLYGGVPTAEAVAFHSDMLNESIQKQQDCDDAFIEILHFDVFELPGILDEVRLTLRELQTYRQIFPDAFVLN